MHYTYNTILDIVNEKKNEFGKCKKFIGALTVELFRKYLKQKGIMTSTQNVYIEGIPIEIDLLIPKKNTKPVHNLLYKPDDVLVIFEFKSSGSFSEKTINDIRNNFDKIKKMNNGIKCVYVTLKEREGYQHAITEENLCNPAFTLFHYKETKIKVFKKNEDCDKLDKFLDEVRKANI